MDEAGPSSGSGRGLIPSQNCPPISGKGLSRAESDTLHRIERCLYAFQSSLVHGPRPSLFLPGNRRTSLELTTRNHHLFTAAICVLTEAHSLILNGHYKTKRSLFYKNRSQIKLQRHMDKAITYICDIIETPRIQLHILSTARGLLAGDLLLEVQQSGTILDCRLPTSVPVSPDTFVIRRCSVTFILIVEKDSVFQKLVNERHTDTTLASALIVTAKGYPDYTTRSFLNALNSRLRLPLLALMDADSYGVEIFLNYKYGPMRPSYEAGSTILLPETHWIGIHPSDLSSLQLDGVQKLPLSQKELKHIKSLQERFRDDQTVVRELQTLADGHYKIEIEALCSIHSNYLIQNYLKKKLLNFFRRQ